MSLQINIAHTGECLRADPVTFSSVDALKRWIFKGTTIAAGDQILMTNRGKTVKAQTLLTEKEIFVYDRQILSPSSIGSSKPVVAQISLPPIYTPSNPPDTLTSQTDVQAWQNLFKARRAWAIQLAEHGQDMSKTVEKYLGEINIIDRAVGAAFANLESPVRNLEEKFLSIRTWADDSLREQRSVLETWEASLDKIRSIPIAPNILSFIAQNGSHGIGADLIINPEFREASTLMSLVDINTLRRASTNGKLETDKFADKIAGLENEIQKLLTNSKDLSEKISQGLSTSSLYASQEASKYLQDLEVVAKKISSDYEHVLTLKSVSQMSKIALLHTRNYLPSLKESAVELSKVLRQIVTQRNATAANAARNLQTESTITALYASVNPQMNDLSLSSEGEASLVLLSSVQRLPVEYGSFLIESVRRREWSEKMKVDSSAIAEELAVYKLEEERRRKKWRKTTGQLIRPESAEGNALCVEISLQGEESPWPVVSREDLEEFFAAIENANGLEGIIDELTELAKDIDRPNRQQSKRNRAFKHGSVHEAALGRGSIWLRGDDETVTSLREDKTRLEDRLKSSESRVRRLEAILHSQSHISRTSSGNIFQSSGQSPEQRVLGTSPAHFSPGIIAQTQDNSSRRSSISSRRFSANQITEEQKLAQRIVQLEAELNTERERSATLSKESNSRKESERATQERIDDALSTKKDLMENLEAQQKEFAEERKLLDEEIERLKLRLEELEDDLDRILGSRDNEKYGMDSKLKLIETKLEATEKDSKARIDTLTQELEKCRGNVEKLEEQVRSVEHDKTSLIDEISNMEVQQRQYEEEQAECKRAMRVVYFNLSAEPPVSDDFLKLLEDVENLTEKTTNHLRDIENALALARADNTLHTAELNNAEAKINDLKEKLGAEEMESFTSRETLAEFRARISSLQAELKDEREQLKALRKRFADGETGSEALRERVAEEESKVGHLQDQLSSKEVSISNLTLQLDNLKQKVVVAGDSATSLSSLLESRSIKANDVSMRLYSHVDRLERLLDSLGFMVSHRDGEMVVQRASKVVNGSSTEADPSSSLGRSISGSGLISRAISNSTDIETLLWMRSSDQEIESEKFAAYIQRVGRLDIDGFSEAITKRIKETEHIARKWQRDARAYRDKARAAQSEAHEKIAFRSFREGDLALFLPTRNQATRPWAAFNVGAPHYFLREQDSHKLRSRDWLLARISKVEERVVDLSKSMNAPNALERRSVSEMSDGGASFIDEENPFDLSDGLRWYMLDAAEEKPGAPSTPGLGKSTVASAHVDVKGSIRLKKDISGEATKTLSKSLDSRRSSSNSKKGAPLVATTSVFNTANPAPSRTGSSSGPAPTTDNQSMKSIGSNEANLTRPDAGSSSDAVTDTQGQVAESPAAAAAASAAKAATNDQQDTKASEISPAKTEQKSHRRVWDSIWTLDVSMERSKGSQP